MLRAHLPEQRTAIVVFDTFRCSSTLLACFANGTFAAMIMEKGVEDRGVSLSQARGCAEGMGRRLVCAGEFHGNPLPGGTVGNSPSMASSQELDGCCLHFQSTNFARAFIDMVQFAEEVGGNADVFVIALANAEATASVLAMGSYKRIVLVCGGFFECLALEDMITGGMLLARLGVPLEHIDDEALTMLACYNSFGVDLERYQRCWTAKVLISIGKGSDITDIVGPDSSIPQSVRIGMQETVLKVRRIGNIPVIYRHLDQSNPSFAS